MVRVARGLVEGMGSMSQALYDGLRSGQWAHPNPAICECGGCGWLASDLDIWFQCPIHGEGVPHPESGDDDFDHAAHRARQRVLAWRGLQEDSQRLGRTGKLSVECRPFLKTADPTAYDWLEAAQEYTDRLGAQVADEAARRQGYSCDLERRWADEAERERRERG